MSATTIADGTIVPVSPAMSLLLDSMVIAEDTLRNDAEGFCWDCEKAADASIDGDAKCETHQASVDEAGRVRALRDALGQARDAGEIAAILAGTGVAI